jgi:ectoine hydroxylase-related dioxygenase (phytanoyl-CoA dioxygenase family)
MLTETLSSRLSAEQVAQFDRDGYIVVDGFFNDDDLQPVIDEINHEVNTRAKELVAKGELSQTFSECGFERQLAMISRETDKVALSIWNGGLAGPAFFNLIRNPKLLDIAESLCGPELIASSVYRLRPKIPNYSYGAVPWHQDSGYTEPYCDKALMLTVWLPLVDANQKNGCMWVIPGVHKQGIVRHASRKGKPYLIIPQNDLPKGKAICAEVKKYGALFLTNMTPHASFDNSSDIVRWSMDLRYQSAALPTNAKITRLPGEVVSTAESAAPPACYPPEADFLVRSKQRPNEVVNDPAIFHRIRKTHMSGPVTSRWTSCDE